MTHPINIGMHLVNWANHIHIFVEDIGVEPMTLPINIGMHLVNWANHIHIFVEDIGVEPMTLCVQGRCSSQLS